jgi:SAM-dependent methyltransferase
LSSGYFCDAEYIDYFYDGLSPWLMDYLAAIRGFPRTDLASGFTYCELGCGTGLSLIIHAAANPGGRFYGVDLNRDHIQRAVQTAEAGQVTNVIFLEEDFTRLLDRDLPRFDVIALHGVWSWVSPAIRRELQGFISNRLQPGGKVYISYNALPGWGQQAPIRQIMAAQVEGMDGSTLDKVAKGLAHLKLLADAGAPSVTSSPQVKALVEHILTADPRYIAHEYFTPYWEPFYFQQVCADMKRIGLNYLGCLPVAHNYGAFCLPRDLQAFFEGLQTRELYETHKDLVLNTVFRRDVYCLGQEQPAGEGGRMEGVILGSLKTREDFQFQFEVKANAVTLDGVLFPQLADLLASSRVAVEDLLRHESLAGYPREEILQGLECLVASGQVVPMAPGPQAPPSGLSPLNRHLLERDLTEAQGVSLACPEAGGGITLPQGDALILYGLHEAGPEGVAAWIEDWGRRHQRELAAGEGFASLEEQVQARVRHLPLAQLGLSVI